jgi:hypothetical protein
MLGALIFASAALAITKTCIRAPCYGTAQKDTLREREGRGAKDTIYGLSGNDGIRAGFFTHDTDILYGNQGNDFLSSAFDRDNRDVLYGGRGRDVCWIDQFDRTIGCEDVRQCTRGDPLQPNGSGCIPV